MPADDGGAVPSNTIRPEAVPPFDVMMTTFDRSSPATVTGSAAVSESPPSGPPMVAVNIIVSPPPDVIIRKDRTLST